MSNKDSLERNVPFNRDPPPKPTGKTKKGNAKKCKCLKLIEGQIDLYKKLGKSKKFFNKKLINKLCKFCIIHDKEYCSLHINNYINNLYKK